MLRVKQSEEQLQMVYESQIMAYLNGSHVDLSRIDE